jgi:ABC-type phosphate/phosphonate transport system substrate-binding protein
VLGLIAGVLTLLGTVAPAGAEKPPPAPKEKELRIGLLQPMFKDIPQALIDTAAKPFQAMIRAKTGMKGSMEILPGYRELADGMKNGKIDLAVFHGYEYAWVKDTPGMTPLVVAVPNCGTVQACLVVNKDSKVKTPACLKGKSVLIPKGTKAHCTMFLDHIRGSLPAADCCPANRNDLSIEEALSAIGGARADAALVDISSLKALESNFPGCYRQLKVIDKSVELPAAIVVYREGALDAKTLKQLKDGLMNCAKTSEGYAFTVFWQLKGFAEVSPDYNTLVSKTLQAYPAPNDSMAPMPHLPTPR